MSSTFQNVSLSVSFKAWTGRRHVASIGNDVGTFPLPFQRWRNFKEAFAPEVVERAVKETSGQVRHVVDPFGGSGTTALASQFLGAKPTIVEVNPYLADLIEAKLVEYNLDEVGDSLARVCKEVWKTISERRPTFPGAPKTFVEPGLDGRYIFSREVAGRILPYSGAIRKLSSPDIRRLFRVLLASIAVPVSNVVISSKGRRYRGGWQDRSVPASNSSRSMFSTRSMICVYIRPERAVNIRSCGVTAGHCYAQ